VVNLNQECFFVIYRQSQFGKSHYELIGECCAQSPESTAKTTDSGVESIANHLDEFESGLEPSAQTEMPSTGSWQVDVALNWHLQYCGSLLNVSKCQEPSGVFE